MSLQLQKLNTLGQSYSYPCVYPVAPILHISPHITAKADSGATNHYLKSEHIPSLTKVIPLFHGPSAILPNNTTITAIHQGTLPFASALSRKAKKALVFPGLSNESLLLIGQFCDDNCTAIFTKESVFILKQGVLLIHGKQNTTDGLWDIKLPSPVQQKSLSSHNTTAIRSYIDSGEPSPNLTAIRSYIEGGEPSPNPTAIRSYIEGGEPSPNPTAVRSYIEGSEPSPDPTAICSYIEGEEPSNHPTENSPVHDINYIITKDKSKSDLARYPMQQLSRQVLVH